MTGGTGGQLVFLETSTLTYPYLMWILTVNFFMCNK